MKCPKCGHNFPNSDWCRTEQNSDSYINYITIYCHWCHKWFKWMEIFTLSEITPPEEIKEDDHF